MITLPLISFLYLYWALIFLFFVFLAINIYHLFASASLTVVSLLVTILILAGGVGVIYLSSGMLEGVSFAGSITLFDLSWFLPTSGF